MKFIVLKIWNFILKYSHLALVVLLLISINQDCSGAKYKKAYKEGQDDAFNSVIKMINSKSNIN